MPRMYTLKAQGRGYCCNKQHICPINTDKTPFTRPSTYQGNPIPRSSDHQDTHITGPSTDQDSPITRPCSKHSHKSMILTTRSSKTINTKPHPHTTVSSHNKLPPYNPSPSLNKSHSCPTP